MNPRVQDLLTRAAHNGGERVVLADGAALTEDGEVVGYGAPQAAFVLTGPGGSLPADVAAEIGAKGKKVDAPKPGTLAAPADVPPTPERTPVDKTKRSGVIENAKK